MATIIFNEEKIRETKFLLQSILDELEISSESIANNISDFIKTNKMPELTEKMLQQQKLCKRQCRNIHELLIKLEKISDIYITEEVKNIQLVNDLPGCLAQNFQSRGDLELLSSNKAIFGIDFSDYKVLPGNMINRNAIHHEEWLFQAIEKYI